MNEIQSIALALYALLYRYNSIEKLEIVQLLLDEVETEFGHTAEEN